MIASTTNDVSGSSVFQGGGRSRTLGRRGAKLLCGTALGCSLLVFAAPQAAWASDECGPNTGQPITCPAGAYPDGVNYSGNAALNLTVQEASTTADSTNVVSVDGGTGAVTVTVGTLEASGLESMGVFATTTSGAISVTSDDITTHGEPDWWTAEGVYAESDTGSITINANSTTVEGTYASALAAITRDADISITSQTVHSTAADASAIVGRANEGGDVTIDSGSLTTISQGLVGYGTAAVTISSDSIEVTSTSGYGYQGIYGRSSNGPVVIDSGTIETSGIRSPGIEGRSLAGTVAITSDTVSTVGDGSVGIYANGFAGVSIDSGTISTTGASHELSGVWRNSDALWATSATGPISIHSDAITTSGGSARGIVVDADGVIEWTGHRGADAANGTGALTIDSGSIVTTGDDATGIFVDHVGAISIASDSIETAGTFSSGIYAYGGGDITITSGSVVAAASLGIVARNIDGDISITSDSVESFNDAGVGAISVTGDINIVSASAVTTSTGAPTGPFTADAVVGISESGDVNIDSGLTRTLADYAYGIAAIATTGDVSVLSEEAITSGFQSYGVYAETQGTVLVGSGVATTTGDNAIGIAALGSAGSSVISGAVSTAGDRAYGVIAQAGGGAVSIDSAEVTTLGDGAYGIRGVGPGGVTIYSGSVSTAGGASTVNNVTRQADGIWAFSSTGPIAITSASIITAGADARGIIVDADAAVPFSGFRGADAANGTGALAIDSGSIVTGGDNAAGIMVDHVGAISITSDTIETAGAYSSGIYVYGGAAGVTIDGGTIKAAGAESLGIAVRTDAGNVAITGTDIRTAGIGAAGIFAETTTGAIDIVAGTVVTTGGPADFTAEGILAITGAGDIDITAQSVNVSGQYASAIVGMTSNADVAITSGSIVSTAEQSITVFAGADQGGDIAVTSGSILTESEGIDAMGTATVDVTSGSIQIGSAGTGRFTGIDARSTDGAVVIDSGSVINASGSGKGINGSAGGSLDITSGSIDLTGVAKLDGAGATIISAAINAVAAGDVTVTSGAISTVGNRASGILATSSGGDLAIDSGLIAATGVGANGIEAYAAGSIGIDSGDIAVAGATATGIFANGTAGVSITSAAIAGTGEGQRGIDVHTDGLAVLRVGDITMSGADSTGIQVSAHDLVLNVTGDVVSTQGFGAFITTSGAAVVNVASGSSIQGDQVGLYLNSGEASVINILGEIVGLSGQALFVEGAAVTINNNSNTIIGGIQLTDGADTFNNNGTWVAMGDTDFGDGDDTIVNEGLFSATGVGGVTITGLETFENNGQMDLRNGTLGDTVDLGTAAYIGGAGSQLLVDVDFATGESDTLAVASATGTTEIVVNNLATTPGFNSGLSFIESDTPLTGNEFALDPTTIENGFVDFNLVFDPATNSYSVQALPSSDSVSMLRAGTAAQDYASKSGEAWSGRIEDLRDSEWAGVGRQTPVEAWGQILFGQRDMEQVGDFDLMGTIATRDLSSESTWMGAQFGVDRQMAMGGGDLVIGVTAGLMNYEMEFSADENRFELDGYNLGVYGAWSLGRLTLSGLGKVDRFDVTADLQELGAKSDFDGSSVDIQGELAYRFGSAALFVEPVVAVDWIKTDLDTLEVAGATAEFDDATSLRARIGGRVGGIWRSGALTFVPFVGAYAIEELEGENEMDFTLGGSNYSVTDQPYDTHGRADVGMTMVGPQGLQAWVKGEADFGDGAEGLTLRLGARWSW